MIIKIEANENGSHSNQSTTPRKIPIGWIEVPDSLKDKFISTGSFCDLTIEDGVLTGITPTERPEPEPEPEPEPTEVDQLKAQVADLQNQILTMRLGGI